MKVALVSSFVPFIHGGGRNIVEWLQPHLEAAGHRVELIYLPFVDTPELLFPQLAAFRTIDLTEQADVVICFRPPAHFIQHPRKVLWFIHHLRLYYDLWDTEYRYFPDTAIHRSRRDALRRADGRALAEARTVFTNSAIVGKRLESFNGVASEVLYPPVADPERYHNAGHGNTIVCLARLEHHKRQHLLIDALALTKEPVMLHLAGTGSSPAYGKFLRDHARGLGLADRVRVDDRWITDEEKIETLAGSLAVAYLPVDEDSYGYPSLEASHSSKPILTTSDSGGVLELVVDGDNGFVVDPDPSSIADAMDRFFRDRALARRLGARARARVDELGITWDRVVERLLS
jgi:glycosyltransferase involved in cell wall biosynthesis